MQGLHLPGRCFHCSYNNRILMPPTLYMIADIRKYVIWKSKFEITIPIQWCLCKSHEKSYWICKTLRNNATLLSMRYSLCLLRYSRARGKENDINFALLFFTLYVVAFSFRSLRRRLCLYRSSDWNPIFLIQRSLITSWRLPSIFCTLLSLPIFFAPSSLRHFINHTILKVSILS